MASKRTVRATITNGMSKIGSRRLPRGVSSMAVMSSNSQSKSWDQGGAARIACRSRRSDREGAGPPQADPLASLFRPGHQNLRFGVEADIREARLLSQERQITYCY